MGVAAYAVLVFITSVIPIDARLAPGRVDKVAHFCEYLLFAWLFLRALRATASAPSPQALIAWAAATGFGMMIELIQAWLPWRSAELADAAMDALGAAFGATIVPSFVFNPKLKTELNNDANP